MRLDRSGGIVKKDLAKIKSTFLGYEDHGIMTAMMQIDYEESGNSQGIGGWTLNNAKGIQFIIHTLKTTGVGCWEKLPGTMIYVISDDEYHGPVRGIQGLSFKGTRPDPFIFADVMSDD